MGSQLGSDDDDNNSSGVVCKDFSCLYYNMPFQRGICVNWELERQIWSQVFKRHGGLDFAATELIVTEPVCNMSFAGECLDELVFEEYGFDGLVRLNGN